jgi:hypothetical protein
MAAGSGFFIFLTALFFVGLALAASAVLLIPLAIVIVSILIIGAATRIGPERRGGSGAKAATRDAAYDPVDDPAAR